MLEVTHVTSASHAAPGSTHPRVWCVNWSHTGATLATSGEDRTVKLWKRGPGCADTLRLVQTLSGDQTRPIRYAQFSPCGNLLATASWDGTVVVYDINEGEYEEKHKLQAHESEVKSCQFSPSGQYLATCGRDKTVYVWQADEEGDFDIQSVLQRHTGDVKWVLWHPNHELLLSGGYDNSINVYHFDGDDWVTGQRIENAHPSTIWSAAFDGTGKFLVTVCAEHSIKVWELIDPLPTSGAKLVNVATLPVAEAAWPFFAVAWSAQSDLIAVGGGDHKVRFYKFDRTEKTLLPLGDYTMDSEVNALAFQPAVAGAAGLLAAGLDDGNVHLLRAYHDA